VIDKSDDPIDMGPFQVDDRILKIGNVPIANGWDIPRAEDALDGRPLGVTVQRGPRMETFDHLQPGLRRMDDDYIYKPDGSSLHCRTLKVSRDDNKTIVSRTVQPDQGPELTFNEDQLDQSAANFLGMVPRIKVRVVLGGSPADNKGIKPGDIVVAYGDKNNPTKKQLMDISKDKFEKGVPTVIEILRGLETLPPITIEPRSRDKTPQLGIVVGGDWEHLVVAGPVPDSPAAKAGIENGATITHVNGLAVHSWTDLYLALRQEIGQELKITYLPVRATAAQEPKTVSLGKLTTAMFDPLAYRFTGLSPALPYKPMMVTVKVDNPLAALAWGAKQTVTFTLGTYVSIRSMIMGYASYKSASGPVGMGAAAIRIAQDSFIKFIWFLAIISAAIAVFNFLPLPVMDGGYAVFLIVEKFRGRPLSVRLTNIIQMTGLFLILGLFLAITCNDIYKLYHGSW
jgi:regulator of sigma E protease